MSLEQQRDAFCQKHDVARETCERLAHYVDQLLHWQRRINLISNASINAIWTRHIEDSWQLLEILEGKQPIYDFGSGGGLPGIVLAITGVESINFVESDQRKCQFLNHMRRTLSLDIDVLNQRIETVTLPKNATITARAFADTRKILDLVCQNADFDGRLLLLKGRSWRDELSHAEQAYDFEWEASPSITDDQSVTLSIRNIKPKK